MAPAANEPFNSLYMGFFSETRQDNAPWHERYVTFNSLYMGFFSETTNETREGTDIKCDFQFPLYGIFL